jgi:polar amino acid transport system substrate-binding protein
MFPKLPYALALALLSCSISSALAEDRVVHLCADQWMPYNGDPADAKPGYVIELAKAIFEPKGIKVEYSVMPWTEALPAVREGRLSGAIGANKEEGAGLVLPTEPIGIISISLVTRADSKWTYDNLASFLHIKFGVIKGYAYWPALDAYIASAVKKGSGVVCAEGDNPLADLMKQLQAGEIDVLAESEPVLFWYLRAHNLDRSLFRIVFKNAPDPIYIAFSPNDEGRRYAEILDAGVKSMRASGELAKLLGRYGLRDWQ